MSNVSPDVRALEGEGDRLLEQCRQREGLLDRDAAFRERQELPRQLARPDACLVGVVERPRGTARRRRRACHRDVSDDGHQDVVEVVSDAARQQPERRDLARLRALLLSLQRVADVAECHHHSDGAAEIVAERRGKLFDRTLGRIAGDEQRAPLDAAPARVPAQPRNGVLTPRAGFGREVLEHERRTAFQRPPPAVHPVSVSATLLMRRTVPFEIRRDHAVSDAPQRHRQPFFFRRERPLRLAGLEQRFEGFEVQLVGLLSVPALILDPAEEHLIGAIRQVHRGEHQESQPVIAASPRRRPPRRRRRQPPRTLGPLHRKLSCHTLQAF